MTSNVTYQMMEGYFQLLRPSKKIFNLEVSRKAIFDQEKADKRMIFYADKIPGTGYEMALVQKVESHREALKLPAWWRSGDTLRFGHTVRLEYEKTVAVNSAIDIEYLRLPDMRRRDQEHQTEPRNSGFYR